MTRGIWILIATLAAVAPAYECAAQAITWSARATVVPTIDGVQSPGEWDDAQRVDAFALRPISVFVKNDDTNLYICFKLASVPYALSHGFEIWFENGNGLFDTGDNIWLVRADGQEFDRFLPGGSDVLAGGTSDLIGAASHTTAAPATVGNYTVEFCGPLNSDDDAHDFSLNPGDHVRFRIHYPGAFWPSPLLGRITIAGANADTDADGLLDGDETTLGTDPADPDTDDDGLLDGTEVGIATDPLSADSDGDSLSDGHEVNVTLTDPLVADTDADGLDDATDPTPLEPGATAEFLEQMARDLASSMDAIALLEFDAPNDNARKGRRNSLANRVRNAANAIAAGEDLEALDLLAGVLAKVDGEGTEPDWMHAAPARQDLADEVGLLVALLMM